MSDRLSTDFFVSQPLSSEHAVRTDADLTARVRSAWEASNPGPRRDDLAGVLRYLDTGATHDSEGRDLSFEKESFSRTELRQARSVADADVVRYLIYRYRFNHYPRHHKVPDFPIVLAIEPTSICNIRCTMCFQVDPRLSGVRANMGLMNLDLFKRVIDEGRDHDLAAIVLASRGEPLLHRDIFSMIRYAKEQGVLDVKLNTNATRLDETRARELLESGVDTLVFSVDAAVKEQFEQIRVGAKFDRIVHNIERFNDLRHRDYGGTRLRTRISMVVLEDSGQDVAFAAEFWRNLVDEFAYRAAIPRANIYDAPVLGSTRPCSLLWERLYIWWDGTVNVCDEDYLSHLSPGKLGDRTIHDIWHGDIMMRYRQRHLAGRQGAPSPCDRCPGF